MLCVFTYTPSFCSLPRETCSFSNHDLQAQEDWAWLAPLLDPFGFLGESFAAARSEQAGTWGGRADGSLWFSVPVWTGSTVPCYMAAPQICKGPRCSSSPRQKSSCQAVASPKRKWTFPLLLKSLRCRQRICQRLGCC